MPNVQRFGSQWFTGLLSRRAFVEVGALALVVRPERLREIVEHASLRSEPTVLKSRAQYLSEAAEFDAGIRDLAVAASIPIITATDRLRLTNIVAAAGPKLDHFHSWMVAQCQADGGLVRWVESELRDSTSVKAFIDRVKRNPASLDTVPAIAALRPRLAAMAAQKRALMQQIILKEQQIAGITDATEAAKAQAAEAQKCQQNWAIVTAILLVVLSTVLIAIAIVVSAVTYGAAELTQTYKGTGADLAFAATTAGNRHYLDCIAAAAALPPDQRAKAIAKCQARWLNEKSAFIV
jgi:hypothetical protein